MLARICKWLAALKSSPAVWANAVPFLTGAGVVVAHRRFVPFVLIAAAMLLKPKLNPDAQKIHALLSFGVVSLSRIVAVHYHVGSPVYLASLIGGAFLLFAYWLEHNFDPKYEHDPWKWGGITDFTSYAVGMLAGLV